MADPTTNETANGSAASGGVQQLTAANLAGIIAQAVDAAVSASTQELNNKLNSLTQALKNTSTNEDTNMEVSTVGNDDAFIGLRNERVAQSGIISQMLKLVAASVDHYVETNKASVAALS